MDGTFIWRKIPTCLEDPVVLNDTVMQNIVVNENADTKFSEIYNVTEVWGKVLELESDDRYAENSYLQQQRISGNIRLLYFLGFGG